MVAENLAAQSAAARCSCECTDPLLRPGMVRLGENHISMAADSFIATWANVYLNGEWQGRCVEAFAGHDGWVLRDVAPTHCAAGCQRGHVCAERVCGDVSIVREVPSDGC